MNRDRFAKRQKTASLKDKRRITIGRIIFVLCLLSIVLCPSCNPEAPWTTKDVNIKLSVKTVSAGFVECEFSTNKEAYYLINIEPVREGYDPMNRQKQFMTLVLDSVNLEYLSWRNTLLRAGETNIAPFASHALNYGTVNRFFTNLEPETAYWIYAFVVDPDQLKPAGRLFLTTVKTTAESVVDVYFEYRVIGYWDYIYPVDSLGNIYSHFPYLTFTADSQFIADKTTNTPEEYFTYYFLDVMNENRTDMIRYGVNADLHDDWQNNQYFEKDHTYYTAIVGFDGFIANNVIYKFTWTGEDYVAYFKDEDSIVDYGEDD